MAGGLAPLAATGGNVAVARRGLDLRSNLEVAEQGLGESRRLITDIRHGDNLTISRWTKEKFRHQDGTLGWTETTVDKLKGWEGFKLS